MKNIVLIVQNYKNYSVTRFIYILHDKLSFYTIIEMILMP